MGLILVALLLCVIYSVVDCIYTPIEETLTIGNRLVKQTNLLRKRKFSKSLKGIHSEDEDFNHRNLENIDNNDNNEKKKQKLLSFNSFWFHYEVIGVILDFAANMNINIDLVQLVPNKHWDELYSKKYNYNKLTKLPSELEYNNNYNMIFLLTDDDMEFPNNRIDNRTVCLDHYYQNRRPLIKHHVSIKPFTNNINEMFVLPIWQYISKIEKINIIKKNYQNGLKPVIALIGNGHNKDPNIFINSISNYYEFEFRIIAMKIPKHPWKNHQSKNLTISFYENIDAVKMFELLGSSNYVGFFNHNDPKHGDGHSMTSSIPNAFSSGCRLIIPSKMNKQIRLNSPLEIYNNKSIHVPSNINDMIDGYDIM